MLKKDDEYLKACLIKCFEFTDNWKESQISHRRSLKDAHKNLDDDGEKYQED